MMRYRRVTGRRRGPRPRWSPGRRPFTQLAVVGLASHVFFELAAGVGMPLASLLGPAPAAGLWAAGTVGASHVAGSRSASADGALATANAVGLAAVVGHLAGWPRRRTRLGLPWLRDCEGLGPELMPIYNSILYVSGVAALLGLARENRSASRRLPALGIALMPVFVAAQHAEHHRLRQLAEEQPGWWNRRLRRPQRQYPTLGAEGEDERPYAGLARDEGQ